MMKKIEKHVEEMMNYKGSDFCDDFIEPKILKPYGLDCKIDCDLCRILQMIWCNEEYTEPEVDWSKVDVDTPVFVKNIENGVWHKRYFKKFEGGKVCTWRDGKTSWSTASSNDTISWKYAKLAEGDEGNE